MASALGGVPLEPVFVDRLKDIFTVPWKSWVATVHAICFATSQSGTTAQRPSPGYVGQFYFDTTLGFAIWAKTLGSAPVWVNATGTPV